MKQKLLSLLLASAVLVTAKSYATVDTVMVGPAGSLTFSPASFTMPLGDTVMWVWSSGTHTTTSTTVPGGAASWSSNIDISSTTFSYVPTVTGTYDYHCDYHYSLGMTGSFTVTCGKLVVPVITGKSVVCAGVPDTLSTPEVTGTTYQWMKNDTAISGASSNSYSFTDMPGSYSLIATVACGTDTSAPTVVTSVANPMPNISDTTIGGVTTFTTDTVPGGTYVWTFGDGSSSGLQNPTHVYTGSDTIYDVMLMVTNASGCTGMGATAVHIGSLFVANLTTSASLAISPNPATDVLVAQYSLSGSNGATIRVINALGQQVYVHSIQAPAGTYKLAIPVSGFARGVYLLEINEDGAKYVRRFAKE